MKLFNRAIRYVDIIVLVVIGFIFVKIINNISDILPYLEKIYSIISTFIYAAIISYILNPLMKFFEKRLKLKRYLSIFFTYAIIIGFILIICIFWIPSLVDSIIELTKSIPSFISQIQEWFYSALKNETMQKLLTDTGILNEIYKMPQSLGNIVLSTLNNSIGGLVSTTGYLIKWVFGFIISIYFLYDKEKMVKFIKTIIFMILKEKRGRYLLSALSELHNMIALYIGSKAIDSIIIGILAFIGMVIINVPYAFLLALIVGFTNMIPYFGPFFGMLVAFLINVFISPITGIIVVVFLFFLQQFDAWFLEPKIVGQRVGLSPILIILAVTIGGGFYGPIGMILAVPIMAIIKNYMDKIIIEYKEKNEHIKELN